MSGGKSDLFIQMHHSASNSKFVKFFFYTHMQIYIVSIC